MTGTRAFLLLLVAAGPSARAAAQGGAPNSAGTVTVVADSSFSRGSLHRWLFGDHYRDLWHTPLQVPVLDLGSFAGGLTPLRKGGGLQTVSLRFQGADGRQYVFRSVRKDPRSIVPEDMRGTFVESVVRDQMSAIHPGGALVLPPLMQAAGILHAPPVLRVMPDDPRLEEFRAEFAGMLGAMEERPTEAEDDMPGFAGAETIEDTEDLIERLWDDPKVKVDSRAYLTARLLDLVVGDWDRHEGQWSWALLGEGESARWQPIPRDRDQAFARYDGLLWSIARLSQPQLLNYSDRYASIYAMTFNGRYLDRRLLNELEWATWDSVARSLSAQLTDEVIDAAVSRLPAEYQARSAAELRRALRRRRDDLHATARRYYAFLADEVTIHGGDHDDRVIITRDDSAAVMIELRERRDESRPYYRRTFLPTETEEIRIYTRDGDDHVVVRGGSWQVVGPKLRIIGGPGRDTLVDLSSGRSATRFYDHGDGTVSEGRSVDRSRYDRPSDTDPAALPERDFGHKRLIIPSLVINSDVGVALGITGTRKGYGFRRQPYATHTSGLLDYSFLRSDFRFRMGARWKIESSETFVTLDMLASGLEGLRFYGFGNGTTGDSPDKDIYLVRQKAYGVGLGLGFGLEGRASAHVAARLRHTFTDPNDPDNLAAIIGEVQPLGYNEYGQLGGSARLEWDSRDNPLGPTRGLHAVVEGEVYPVSWDEGLGTFGAVEGSVSTYLTPVQPGWVTLAFRGGGRKAFGDYPYFAAAYLGASESLRGFPKNRFAGDASLYGNAELRLRVARTAIILPGEFGVFGLLDAGRVYHDLDPEVDDSWHSNAGGGIFFGVHDRSIMLSIGVAKGDEPVRFYVGFGLGY